MQKVNVTGRFLRVLGILFVFAYSGMAAPDVFHVSVKGQDTWSGRFAQPLQDGSDGPFATLQRARDAIRSLKAEGGLTRPVEVLIHEGIHVLRSPLVLTPEDSGTADCSITWRAAAGEHVVLRGAVPVSDWQPWRDGIFRADLDSVDDGPVICHQLFLADPGNAGFSERQTLARYPNADPEHPRTGGYLYAAETGKRPNQEVLYADGDIPDSLLRDLSQVEVVSTYNLGWQFAITPIERVDARERILTVRRVRGCFLRLNRFFLQNSLAALDMPGEWFLDYGEQILYFRPPETVPDQWCAWIPVVDTLIEVSGTIPYPHGYLNTSWQRPHSEFPLAGDVSPYNPVRYVRFVGLDLECSRQDGIRMTGAENCEVVACRVTNVGNIGINLGGLVSSFAEVGNPRATPADGHPVGAGGGGQILLADEPCRQCRVVGCDVWSTGCEGIMLYGTANLAENNHVHDIGLYAKDAPCINLLGEENVALRNTLHDCPRCAIFIKGVDNVAELNDCHHANLETTDMGVIRMVQRNACLKGNVIRHNLIRDSVGYGFRPGPEAYYESPFYTWGVYLDDYTCGTLVEGNVIARCARGGVMIHGGGDNVVVNNIIFNAGRFMIEFAPMKPALGTAAQVFAGNRAERNILVCTEPDTFPYRFTGKTADMPSFRDNMIWTGGSEPGFILYQHVAVKGLSAWLDQGFETGAVLLDPKLRSPQDDDFMPVPDSPVWSRGFQPIPIAQAGCFPAPERAGRPVEPEWHRVREEPLLPVTPGASRPPQQALPIQWLEELRDIREDFEDIPVGGRPRLGDCMAPSPSEISISEVTAASGKHSLKFLDAAGLKYEWLPRLYYPLHFREYPVRVSFGLYLDGAQPPQLTIDPRQYSDTGKSEFFSGPTLRLSSDGHLSAQEEELMVLPFNVWLRLDMVISVGEKPAATSMLTVELPNEASRQFEIPHGSAQFHWLERLVIASMSSERSVFYLDDVLIHDAAVGHNPK